MLLVCKGHLIGVEQLAATLNICGVKIPSEAMFWSPNVFQHESLLNAMENCHWVSAESQNIVNVGSHVLMVIVLFSNPKIKVCFAWLESHFLELRRECFVEACC